LYAKNYELKKVNLIQRVKNTLSDQGLIITMKKILLYPIKLYRRYRIFSSNDIKFRFSEIHRLNTWGNTESISGPGSTLSYTRNLRKELPKLFKKYEVNAVFDAPCGDFNWMQLVLEGTSIKYIGADIVEDLIDSNGESYGSENIKFRTMNLITDEYPKCDLMICRDLFFHLSYEDIFSVIRRFLESDIDYILTTTHVCNKKFDNQNVGSGRFRLIDLFSAPFCFPQDYLMKIDDWREPDPERILCLWSRAQLKSVLNVA
jgi:hypothetical protein